MTAFDPDFRTKLCELIIWRRDVRRFRADALPTGTVDRIVALASLAPSRLSQPWRFVIVDHVARRGSSANGILPLQ